MPAESPTRIVKLLEILECKQALKLVMMLPKNCTLSSNMISKRANIKPSAIDFINDAREKKLTDADIYDKLMEQAEARQESHLIDMFEEDAKEEAKLRQAEAEGMKSEDPFST